MALTLLVQLWARPGNEHLLIEYEDQVLGRLAAYGARICQRVRATDASAAESDGPFEAHVLEFPSEAALGGTWPTRSGCVVGTRDGPSHERSCSAWMSSTPSAYSGAAAIARSTTRAAASTVASSHFRPTSCTAIGNAPSNPVGTVAAGAPVRLAGSMNT